MRIFQLKLDQELGYLILIINLIPTRIKVKNYFLL